MGNFYTDVIRNDPRYTSVDRVHDVELLEPRTRELVQQIVQSAESIGIAVTVYETYRSQARQEELFMAGVTQLRKVGVHHYGLACDIVRDMNGEPSWEGDFSFLGSLAHSSGLIWGDDWGVPTIAHTFRDNVHVQRCSIQRQPLLFAGLWYPDNLYNPYDDGGASILAGCKQDNPGVDHVVLRSKLDTSSRQNQGLPNRRQHG